MLRILNAAFVIAALVGLAAPATVSADQWTIDGLHPYVGTGRAYGELTLTGASGATTTCDVTMDLDLANPSGVAAGQVISFVFGASAGGTCTTTIPGCTTVSISATALPWGLSTSGVSVAIGSLAFIYSYSGTGCPLNGIPFAVSGYVTGSMAGDVVSFSNAGPLSGTVGSMTLDGDVTLATTDGDPIELF